MYTKVKTKKELIALRESCRMASVILDTVFAQVERGITGIDINILVKKELKAMKVKAAFQDYQGFPAAICISTNSEVVHGIPNIRQYEDGDLMSLDFGVDYKGMISDTARTVVVGGPSKVSKEVASLIAGTEESLMAGIKVLKDGVQTGDIGAAVQSVLDRYKLGIVQDLVGHGVGHAVHEDPNIPNNGFQGTGDRLKAGMTIAIEPMATIGDHKVTVDNDGWTIRTADGSLSAHFEHTVLITESGFDILTVS